MRFPVINMSICIVLANTNTIAYAVDINYYYALRQALVSLHIYIYKYVLQSRKYKNVNCTLHKEL